MGLLSLSSRAVRGEILRQLETLEPATWLGQIAYVNFDSDMFNEDYSFLGDIPVFKKWVGQRERQELADFKLIVKNEHFETTLPVYKHEWQFDKTGQVQNRVNALPSAVETHYQSQLTDLIVAGESTACYTGQFFFDTDHVVGGSGTFNNDITVTLANLPIDAANRGTTTAPGAETLAHAMLQAIQAMYGFKSDKGTPINQSAKAFTVMVPVPFMGAAGLAIGEVGFAYGRPNPLRGIDGMTINVVINPFLPWTNKLAVFRSDGAEGSAALIAQRMGPIDTTVQAEGSYLEHTEKRWEFGIDMLTGVGYGLPQHACLVTLA